MKKHAMVTGCSSGIGFALTELLLQKNYAVIATARKEADLRRLTSMGATALFLDLNEPVSIEACVRKVKERTTHLYALINNAAYAQPGSIQDLTIDSMQRQFQTNVFGTIELTNQLMPLLLEESSARLVFLSSILGVVSAPCLGAYCASKYALEALISSLRMELSHTKVRVISIRPGAIETEFRQRAVKELKAGIAIDDSVSKERYQRSINNSKPASRKRADPSKVAAIVVSAIEERKPKTAYYVTVPAIFMGALRRFIPERWVERIMQKHS